MVCDRTHTWPAKPNALAICPYRKGLTTLGAESADLEMDLDGGRDEGKGEAKASACVFSLSGE